MTMAAPSSLPHRSVRGCLCCGCTELHAETTLISPFLARRALAVESELTALLFCRQCGFRFFERGLAADEAARYYAGYRDEAYYAQRHAYEPFYTRGAHRDIATFLASAQRRQALAAALAEAGAAASFGAVLDYGGGDGGLIADIPAERRTVFDFSGAAPVAGISEASGDFARSHHWDLVVCAQVLEHVDDPAATLRDLTGLLAPQGWLYLEVPDELWSNHAFPGRMRDAWLRWLAGRRHALIAADTLATTCRILLGVLPPFGFVPMREHLQYFTESALSALVSNSNLTLIACGRNAVGQIFAVARNEPASDAASGET